jgi:hypothetical protein
MGHPLRDTAYLHGGRPDTAAYIMGGRVCGGAMLLLACVAVGAVVGAGVAVADRGPVRQATTVVSGV